MTIDERSCVEANGAAIPVLGFGTWQLEGEVCVDAVKCALEIGYRHIDTAQIYGNETEVGEGLAGSGVDRDSVFVTTKVWMDQMEEARLQGSVELSLKRLGLDWVDLLLIHWPNPEVPLEETMAALSEVKRFGMTRHIGISNFPVALMEEAIALASAPLVTNQVEYHPHLDQSVVLGACRRDGLALTAYSPLGRGRLLSDPVVTEIADAHGKGANQVILRWLIQQESVVAIPRSGNPDHIESNFDIFDFSLSEDEMARIFSLAEPGGRMTDPDWAPQWD
ncbi:2,5-diketo-D-gluconic acid reductase B [Methyloligella halotolerans]|uniref:2,5-diketo-D-gluconic acid reductase B n=1 Tax=Methyloligella halotolerans TaxID=1177755 RepID=A0A1E2S1I7_9HYPH|nr:aldo/keto reductase [Methyloligella halotolerans]ODA68347.1 2,5-diketo-D-gluconic acid reductase B [Methyloligella halotolerans]